MDNKQTIEEILTEAFNKILEQHGSVVEGVRYEYVRTMSGEVHLVGVDCELAMRRGYH